MSLRERKKLLAQNAIVEAALELVRERGYEATTIGDIADRATLSKSTLFRYYGTKEDIFFLAPANRVGRLIETLESADPSKDAWKTLRTLVLDQAVEFTVASGEFEQQCVDLWFSEPALQRRYLEIASSFQRIVADFLARSWGIEDDDLYECEIIGWAVFGLLTATVRARSANAEKAREVMNDGFDILEYGVGPYSARRRKK